MLLSEHQTLSSAALDEIWINWNRHQKPVTLANYACPYSEIDRNSIVAQKFENFLWTQGAHVKQMNHERYLVFFKQENTLIFVLKWAMKRK